MPHLVISIHSGIGMIAFIQTDSTPMKISIFNTHVSLNGSIALVENYLKRSRNYITTLDQNTIQSLNELDCIGATFSFGTVDSDLIEKVIEQWKNEYNPHSSTKKLLNSNSNRDNFGEFISFNMPQYTSNHGKINLEDYTRIKGLTTGKTNRVSLWEHKQDSNLKIVIKIPNGSNSDLVQHNIHAINTFFGKDSAWQLERKIQGKEGFAMKYYEGITLSSEEEEQLIKKKASPLRTISKNGLLFTILDLNKDNFLKLSNNEFIPIDFDYMIIHDGAKLLPYQEMHLRGSQQFIMRAKDFSEKDATEYILDSYPADTALYFYEQWGNKYLKTDKYIPRVPKPDKENKVVLPFFNKDTSPKEDKHRLSELMYDGFYGLLVAGTGLLCGALLKPEAKSTLYLFGAVVILGLIVDVYTKFQNANTEEYHQLGNDKFIELDSTMSK